MKLKFSFLPRKSFNGTEAGKLENLTNQPYSFPRSRRILCIHFHFLLMKNYTKYPESTHEKFQLADKATGMVWCSFPFVIVFKCQDTQGWYPFYGSAVSFSDEKKLIRCLCFISRFSFSVLGCWERRKGLILKRRI